MERRGGGKGSSQSSYTLDDLAVDYNENSTGSHQLATQAYAGEDKRLDLLCGQLLLVIRYNLFPLLPHVSF